MSGTSPVEGSAGDRESGRFRINEQRPYFAAMAAYAAGEIMLGFGAVVIA